MEDISHLIDMHLIRLKGSIDIQDKFEIHYQKKTPIMQHIKMLFFTIFLKRKKKKDGNCQTFKANQCQPHCLSDFKLHFSLLFYSYFCSGNIGNDSCDDANILYLFNCFFFFLPLPLTA